MKFDVLIVGASSSGLFASELLAARGVRVGVFERQAAVDPAERTLIVTPELARILGPMPEEVALHQTSKLSVTCGEHTAVVSLGQADIIVERATLTRWLAERAQTAGAELHLDMRFRGLTPSPGGLEARFERRGAQMQRVHAGAIIGADGVGSDVGRAVRIPLPGIEPVLQAKVKLPPGWDPDVTGTWFDVEETRYFYWLIPESGHEGVVGLVGDGSDNPLKLLSDFLDRHGLRHVGYQGARVALHHPRLRPYQNLSGSGVYLIGDAAGQVKVTTVGGTVTGLRGAEAAVSALLDGSSYQDSLRTLRRELNLHWLIRSLLDGLGNRDYGRLVESLTPRVLDFLASHNRDRMASVFWRLLLEPRLLSVGMRAVLGLVRPA